MPRSASGKLQNSKKGVWGAARGVVKIPIQQVYRRLLDHYTIKDPKKVKLRVYDQERTGYDAFHLVMVEVSKPISLFWEEDWGYVVSDGTPEAPKKIVISYQKVEGTPYISRLCGSIVLLKSGDSETDVYLYEEIDALGKRSQKDTISSHLGTLKTLGK